MHDSLEGDLVDPSYVS